ncbi:MAG: glutathione S-transferase N-terminal domain-containing protein [Planctomycetes bacterium]|nr:glutathione S-transferase N-terminal domain-containing protein [Planctomycetota bacterium]
MGEWTLYQYPGDQGLPSLSPPCAKVYLALRLSGLRHRVQDIGAENVKRYSPTGRVPALRLPSGKIVVDSIRILDTLEAVEGLAQPLSPREPAARAADRLWEHFANDTLYWCAVVGRWMVPANCRRVACFMGGQSWLRQRLVEVIGSRAVGGRAKGQGTGLKEYDEVVADWERHLRVVVDGLGAGPYLGGREQPGRGDLAMAGLLAQVGWRDSTPRLQAALAEHPALRAHTRRVFEACEAPAPDWV